MCAPEVDLSASPNAYLKTPIRNVVIINLESVRADVLPISTTFFEATESSLLTENLTAQYLTPFVNSLIPNSLVMNDASATSSYTLKTLLSTFCGMYPLNVNFMEESRHDRHFYQQCLPQLVSTHFLEPQQQHRWWQRAPASRFRTAFFQTSENSFDHQGEEFSKMGWGKRFYAPDVLEFSPGAKKLGWFGPGDNDLLPLFFNWVDRTLAAKKQFLAGILTTSTHYPFPFPEGETRQEYVDNDLLNKYLNSIHMTDGFLEKLIRGFEERGVINETMFVMIGDHGHAFDDWNHKIIGALDNYLESGFRVPFIIYSPTLREGGRVGGKFTNMDILPSVMDALISSSQDASWDAVYTPLLSAKAGEDANLAAQGNETVSDNTDLTTSRKMADSPRAEENLLDLTQKDKRLLLESLLDRYEGISIFRRPLDPNHLPRITFHLDNPGNAHIILLQYPLKLVYDAIGEQTSLYDLSHDPQEWHDLLNIPYSGGGSTPPAWVDWTEEDLTREFRFNWWISGMDEFGSGRTAPDRDETEDAAEPENAKENSESVGNLNLHEAFNWAENAFEILLGWSWINRERYLTGKMEVDMLRSTALGKLRDEKHG